MITCYKANERGATNTAWLQSWHTFSFGRYHDPARMGFGVLRVINDDIIKPGTGFGSHPHHDMEIISYVLEGALTHQDSLGNGSVIVPGEVQRMSAGSGIIHSEKNQSSDQAVHLLQIWIVPSEMGITPSYEQKDFTQKRHHGRLTLVASKDGREGSLTIHQDAFMYVLDLGVGDIYEYTLQTDRMVWVQMARGSAWLNHQMLTQGDGVAIHQEKAFQLRATTQSEILIFDLHATLAS